MKKALLIFILMCGINADEILEVSALYFNADETSGIIELLENVAIKKGKDELYAPKVIINIDKNRKPTQYSAFGGVDFVVVTKDNRHLKGRANEVYYNALNGEYRLKGNSKVEEENKVNTVVGEEIIINNDIGFVNITGTQNKPAKLIFQMENKQEQNDKSKEK